MISYISGKIIQVCDKHLIIDVGGIGLKILTPTSTLSKISTSLSHIKLYTFFEVSENTFSLYGFLTEQELNIFTTLLSVSGIGPKTSFNILSSISIDKLKQAIVSDDISLIKSIPGVGKKTAQRIILELKDKIEKETVQIKSRDIKDDIIQDAISALLSLNYTKQEATEAVNFAKERLKTKDINSATLIKESLQYLGKK